MELNLPKRNKKRDGRRSGGDRKHGRNRLKCAHYRSRVGKPLGRGVPGNRAH